MGSLGFVLPIRIGQQREMASHKKITFSIVDCRRMANVISSRGQLSTSKDNSSTVDGDDTLSYELVGRRRWMRGVLSHCESDVRWWRDLGIRVTL